MNRRRILAAVGGAVLLPSAGCIEPADGERADLVTPSSAAATEVGENCGPGEQPLAARFTDEPDDSTFCTDSAEPSLAVENQREDPVTVTVDIDDAMTETYALEPGDRIVERSAFVVRSKVTGTVSVNGEPDHRVKWPARSCHRHGIVLTSDGVEIGWVERLAGPGDTIHDCYAGDDATVGVYSLGESRTIEVTIDDLCAETTYTDTFEVDAGEGAFIRDVLTNGGMYDVTVNIDGGESQTYEFYEGCRGVEVIVEEDGTVRIGQIPGE